VDANEPARDLVQLRVRQGQWENCLTAAVSRCGRAPVCLVASDSWPRTFAFSLANPEEEVELSSAQLVAPNRKIPVAVNSASGTTFPLSMA
jgi:hypothetical protein